MPSRTEPMLTYCRIIFAARKTTRFSRTHSAPPLARPSSSLLLGPSAQVFATTFAPPYVPVCPSQPISPTDMYQIRDSVYKKKKTDLITFTKKLTEKYLRAGTTTLITESSPYVLKSALLVRALS